MTLFFLIVAMVLAGFLAVLLVIANFKIDDRTRALKSRLKAEFDQVKLTASIFQNRINQLEEKLDIARIDICYLILERFHKDHWLELSRPERITILKDIATDNSWEYLHEDLEEIVWSSLGERTGSEKDKT